MPLTHCLFTGKLERYSCRTDCMAVGLVADRREVGAAFRPDLRTPSKWRLCRIVGLLREGDPLELQYAVPA